MSVTCPTAGVPALAAACMPGAVRAERPLLAAAHPEAWGSPGRTDEVRWRREPTVPALTVRRLQAGGWPPCRESEGAGVAGPFPGGGSCSLLTAQGVAGLAVSGRGPARAAAGRSAALTFLLVKAPPWPDASLFSWGWGVTLHRAEPHAEGGGLALGGSGQNKQQGPGGHRVRGKNLD